MSDETGPCWQEGHERGIGEDRHRRAPCLIRSRCDIDLSRDDGVIFMRRLGALMPLGHSMMTGASMAVGLGSGACTQVAVRRRNSVRT